MADKTRLSSGLRLELPTHRVDGVVLHFAARNTKLLKGDLVYADTRETFATLEINAFVARATWDRQAAHDSRAIDILVSYEGECPAISDANWIADGPLGIEAFVTHKVVSHDPQGAKARRFEDGTDYEAARDRAIEHQHAAQCFFAALDRSTTASSSELRAKLDAKLGMLLNLRAHHRSNAIENVASGLDIGALENASELFITLDTSHFAQFADPPKAFGFAFESFACGRLWAADPELTKGMEPLGTANSSNFFKFTELAFRCISELGEKHKEFWAGRLEALVRASEIFAQHGRSHTAPGERGSFTNADLIAVDNVFPMERWREIRHDYDVLLRNPYFPCKDAQRALEIRFGELIYRALREVVSLAVT